MDQQEVEALLRDWVEAKVRLVWEFSGDIRGGVQDVLEEAQARAERIGIGWGVHLVPGDVVEQLARWAQEDED